VDFTTAALHNGFRTRELSLHKKNNKRTKTLDFFFLSSFIKGEIVKQDHFC
jgi:hypothetical protein